MALGKKTGGRTKGIANKVTIEARQAFVDIINKQTDKVQDALEELANEDPFKYLVVMGKLLSYVMPRQIDIKSDGESLKAPIIMLSNGNKTK